MGAFPAADMTPQVFASAITMPNLTIQVRNDGSGSRSSGTIPSPSMSDTTLATVTSVRSRVSSDRTVLAIPSGKEMYNGTHQLRFTASGLTSDGPETLNQYFRERVALGQPVKIRPTLRLAV